MMRVNVICEGQTEETFVREVLNGFYAPKEIYFFPRLIGRPGHKGGNVRFERICTDAKLLLRSDASAWCTTFFDFYGLPAGFPGKKEAQSKKGTENKAACFLAIFSRELENKVGIEAMRRFIPYIQMHEFESLLFSDPERLANSLGRFDLSEKFRQIRDIYQTPEDINDGPETAPAKRIVKWHPSYSKPVGGLTAALEVGLAVIRKECPLFGAWLKRIENENR